MKREQFTAEDIMVNKNRYLFTHKTQCENTSIKSQEQDKTQSSMQVEDLKKQKEMENQKII